MIFVMPVVRPRAAPARSVSLRRQVNIQPVRLTTTLRRNVIVEAHKLNDSPLQDARANDISSAPGVYAVYDKAGALQYVGLSRKVSASVANHVSDLPDQIAQVRVLPIPEGTKEALQEAWRAWVTEYVEANGEIPSGNAPGNTTWTARKAKPVRPEIRLTPGKGAQDLMVPIETIVDQVVKSVPVVAFIKGTRTEPQCGFSYKMLSILNESKVDYEVVNVLDELHNPGLREAIKTYSAWPTIPQLYVKGEFVGGCDIVDEMQQKGELQPLLSSTKAPAAPAKAN